ncbi:MAG: 30S ribosomal protein S12 methylthiotransferase RimO [Candidatus Omnitrophica bacterium]|nr:30S ribosomal protein S12 methylthiotransferase RimO [Candidatus Omnitrophota bacterium]
MKIHVVSLGCARTLVDSEGLAGLLEKSGHSISQEAEGSDCVVINTCAFIRDAEEESISTILEAADLKKRGKIRRLYVAGCLPQKRRAEREDLLKMLPEVDGFIGTGDLPRLPELIERQESRFFVTSPVPTLLFGASSPRHRMTPKHFAYLKVSEGCDHACAFCSIPQYRGAHRSRTVEDLGADAERLAADGAVELNLIGQDTSYYGADLYGRLSLPRLLERLSQVKGVRWLRILYAHPAHVTEELISALADLGPVVKYLDIPLQHINDRLLTAMRRETDGAHIRRLVERLRSRVPGITIRTTFIAGFPGETEAEAEELARFLEEARFERVGIFPFLPEPKTTAERMGPQVPEKVRRERVNRLMEIQQGISRENNAKLLGREVEVLVEEASEEKGVFLGRTPADAPEVDGQVFLHSREPAAPGALVRALVTDSCEYDLVAEA